MAEATDACEWPLPRPSTERLLKTHEKLLHFCAHLDRGLDSIETFVWMGEGATTHDVRGWFREFDEQWRRASAVARRAAREITNFAPSNARELPAAPAAAGESYIDAELGAVASVVAGERAEVRCWSKQDWPQIRREMHRFSNERIGADTAGFVAYGDHRINLAPDICMLIRQLIDQADEGLEDEHAFALGTLTHEARHVAGTLNETTATCEGASAIKDAATRLGLSSETGAALEEIFRERVHPNLPAAYRAAACQPTR